MFRHEIHGGLCPFHKALSEQSAGADGDFRLVHIVADAFGVVCPAQNQFNTLFLVVFQYFIVYGMDGEDIKDGKGVDEEQSQIVFFVLAHPEKQKTENQGDAKQYNPLFDQNGKDEQQNEQKSGSQHPEGQSLTYQDEDQKDKGNGGARVVLKKDAADRYYQNQYR